MFLFRTSNKNVAVALKSLMKALKYTRERRLNTFHRLYCLYVLLRKTDLDRLKKKFLKSYKKTP